MSGGDLGGEPWLDRRELPSRVLDAFGGFDWELFYQYEGHSVVYRITRDERASAFLKIAPAGQYPSLDDEAERMRWAGVHLPVPAVLDLGAEDGVSWLAMSALVGRDGTHPEELRHPEKLTRGLARGLRRFHEDAPVAGCPFDFRVDAALAHVHGRLRAGLVDRVRDFHPEHRGLTPEAAVALLESSRPPSEDIVVCHGDYCPPNILFVEGEASGFVDLGELGVADRWWDLAVATWSLTWNLGPGFEGLFLSEYGANPDPDRMAFYRLMYDLVS